jgi:pSer/pThr/pTyr-binding forkhead associated (FHA) protein
MSTVTVTSGPATGLSMDIDRELVVGREDADLTIGDPQLSRRHALLRPADRGVEIEDLKSLNGTIVNGQRISGTVTLTASGTIKVGKSELRVEVDVPQATEESERAPVPLTDLPDPDVTAVRKSPAAQPDVTAPRPLPGIPEGPPPDVTSPRRSPPPSAPPETPRTPAAEPPVPAAPAAAAAAARPGPADGPPAGPPPGPRGRGPTIGLAVAGVFVLAVVVLLALANAGSSNSTHQVNSTLRVATVNSSPTDLLLAGVERDSQTLNGAVTMDVHLDSGNALALKAPTEFSARIVHRFDDGSLTSIVSGTAKPAGSGSISYSGTGRYTGGTKTYDGAKGRFRLSGTVRRQDGGAFTLSGRVVY